MKKIFLTASAFVLSLGLMAQVKVDDAVKFGEEKYDFGKIKQGIPVTYSFEIKNISDKPVVVENTTASCGCTAPDKIVDPIMPGASAKLKVVYNAAAIGVFTKDIHVKLAGIDQPKTVQITGEVVAAEGFDNSVKEVKEVKDSKEKPKIQTASGTTNKTKN